MRTKDLQDMKDFLRLNSELSEEDTLRVFFALSNAQYITPPEAAMRNLIKGNYSTDKEVTEKEYQAATIQINELLDKYSKMSESNKREVQAYRSYVTKWKGEQDEE